LVGVVRRLVNITNGYLKARQQFGPSLGSNQVLQHRMAELFILQEEARALTHLAQRALDAGVPDRARFVSGAKAYVGRAARRVANEAVQIHGGIGVTEELEVSHYFRRVMVANALFGGPDAHLLRFAAAGRVS
jgi:alkylation response protein AidB-like acyl-CoA dehydrogenase